MPNILGIHHITAIAGDPRRTLDFYTSVLGMRLVKKTVNFDDPTTYHLYFGDELGRPGTIFTFFPWVGAPRGNVGWGQVTELGFSVPPDSLGYWLQRLRDLGISHASPVERFEEDVLSLEDPDGLMIELVADPDAEVSTPWEGGGIPPEHAVRGFHSATVSEEWTEDTAELLGSMWRFRLTGELGNRFRYEVEGEGPGRRLDILCLPGAPRGRVSVGSVHHLAWRVAGADEQKRCHDQLVVAGYRVTPVLDRHYFRSIYFREPGGALFEIATDAPGFTVDEDAERLGSDLMLPPWLEGDRERIERSLPDL